MFEQEKNFKKLPFYIHIKSLFFLIIFCPLFIFSQECDNPEIEGFVYGGYFQDTHYYISETTSTWESANNIIGSLDIGYFVAISSQEENDFLTSMMNSAVAPQLPPYPGDAWIGLYQDCPGFNNDCENNQTGWQWVNGEDITYANWFCGDFSSSCPDGGNVGAGFGKVSA